MKFIRLLLMIVFISTPIYAASLNGELVTSVNTLKEGDLFEGTIRIWPLENAPTESIKAFEGKTFLNSFTLMQIINSGPSENNAEVLEIKGQFIVKNSSAQSSQNLQYGIDNLELKWKGPELKTLTEKNKDFFIESQSVIHSSYWLIMSLLVVLVVGSMFLFRGRLKLMFKKRVKLEYTSEYFDDLFNSASTRGDFEKIYALKNIWLPLLKVKTPSHQDFFKVMNQHQFKKSWGVDEITETKSAFENIRRSFSA